MKSIYLFGMFMFFSFYGYSQGCSDAGLCSIGNLKNNVADSAKFKLDFGLNYGLGEQKTNTINPYIQYRVNFNDHLFFQSKITSTYATGFLGSAFDIGDIYGTISYKTMVNSANSLNFVGGVKIPLTSANDKNSRGKPLSLDYQSSIGTYDAIAGINYIVQKTWEFEAEIQVPVVQINRSTYFPDLYSDPRAEKFSPTNNFRRKSDLLAEVGYYIPAPKSSVTVKPSVFLIFHTGNDTYVNRSGAITTIYDSKGFTLNGAITATKKFKNADEFEVIAGSPFFSKKVRPDGLTRDLVINLQYSIAF